MNLRKLQLAGIIVYGVLATICIGISINAAISERSIGNLIFPLLLQIGIIPLLLNYNNSNKSRYVNLKTFSIIKIVYTIVFVCFSIIMNNFQYVLPPIMGFLLLCIFSPFSLWKYLLYIEIIGKTVLAIYNNIVAKKAYEQLNNKIDKEKEGITQ